MTFLHRVKARIVDSISTRSKDRLESWYQAMLAFVDSVSEA